MRAGRRSAILVPMLVALCLSACRDRKNPPTLKVSRQSVSFSNDAQEHKTPAPQTLSAEVLNIPDDGAYVGVAYSNEGLEKVAYDLSSNPVTIQITPKSPLQVGSLKTVKDQVVIAVCADADCKSHYAGSPAVVDVSYTVSSRFNLARDSFEFTYVLGYPLDYFQYSTSLDFWNTLPIPWAATASPDWLQLHSASGQTPTPVSMKIDHERLLQLGLGSHAGEITLSHPQGLVEKRVVPVSLMVVAPAFSSNPSTLDFGGADGTELSPQWLYLTLETSSKAHAWTASGPPWLMLSQTSGTVSSAQTPLMVSVDPTGLPSGTHTDVLTFTALVSGVPLTQTVPVSLSLVPHRLQVSDNGVALVRTPSASKLTQTVKVKDSMGQRPSPWSATSNQPWLSVTANADDTLTVTANPDDLAADTLHLATVTVSTLDGSVPGDTLQVGLWVGSSASNSRDTLTVTSSYEGLEMDPLRPYAYVHDGVNLDVYNVYTASRVASLPSLGGKLGAMAISTDGSALYVLDEENWRILPVSLPTLTPGAPRFAEPYTNDIGYARPGGRGVLFSNRSQFTDAQTGEYVQMQGSFGDSSYGVSYVTASVDGSVICGGGSRLSCSGMRFTSADNGTVILSHHGSVWDYSNLGVALTQDGSRLYTARQFLSRFGVYKPWDLSVLSERGDDLFTDKVAVGPDDRVYGVAHAVDGPKDVWVFDAQGTPLASYRVAPQAGSVTGLEVSGDGKRFVTLTNQETVEFISSP